VAGRSNVGKSSLINALVRQRLARTSAAPGKTRLANIYRVARGAGSPFYLVDLPGYGFARAPRRQSRGSLSQSTAGGPGEFDELARAVTDRHPGILLLVDSRHPGLDNDREAWAWLKRAVPSTAVVATKIDKLARGERIRALRELESVFEGSVLPVSAVTGEGLDELWKLIERLANNSRPPRRSNSPSRSRSPRATAPRPPRK
jgi:GTP-binding protein